MRSSIALCASDGVVPPGTLAVLMLLAGIGGIVALVRRHNRKQYEEWSAAAEMLGIDHHRDSPSPGRICGRIDGYYVSVRMRSHELGQSTSVQTEILVDSMGAIREPLELSR